MSYMSEPIFHRTSKSVPMYEPTASVDCYVVRAALFGIEELGKRGIYHSGILFNSIGRQWAFELILSDFGNLIPRIVNEAVEVDNFITIGYYPPLDAHLWRSYWTETSARVCTIEPMQYKALVEYILQDFGPRFPRYVPFGIYGKPMVNLLGSSTEIQTSNVYTVDNTCDKLPMHCFQWLSSAYSVLVAPFPVTRIALQTPTPPKRMSPTSSELLAYAQELDAFKSEFSLISHRNYLALPALWYSLKHAKSGPFRYALSIDPVTSEQSYYQLPKDDVTVAITDVFLRVMPDNDLFVVEPNTLFVDSKSATSIALSMTDEPVGIRDDTSPGASASFSLGCRQLTWCRRDTAIVASIAAGLFLFAILFGCIYGIPRRRRG
jgi:hypothetical protein